jgi:hypothetical protein
VRRFYGVVTHEGVRRATGMTGPHPFSNDFMDGDILTDMISYDEFGSLKFLDLFPRAPLYFDDDLGGTVTIIGYTATRAAASRSSRFSQLTAANLWKKRFAPLRATKSNNTQSQKFKKRCFNSWQTRSIHFCRNCGRKTLWPTFTEMMPALPDVSLRQSSTESCVKSCRTKHDENQ